MNAIDSETPRSKAKIFLENVESVSKKIDPNSFFAWALAEIKKEDEGYVPQVEEDENNILYMTKDVERDTGKITFDVSCNANNEVKVNIELVDNPNFKTMTRSKQIADSIKYSYNPEKKSSSSYFRNFSSRIQTEVEARASLDDGSVDYSIVTNFDTEITSKSGDIPELLYGETQSIKYLSVETRAAQSSEVLTSNDFWQEKDILFWLGPENKGLRISCKARYYYGTNKLSTVEVSIKETKHQKDVIRNMVYSFENEVSNMGWEAQVEDDAVEVESSIAFPEFLSFKQGSAVLEFDAQQFHPAIPARVSVPFPQKMPDKLPARVSHLEPVVSELANLALL